MANTKATKRWSKAESDQRGRVFPVFVLPGNHDLNNRSAVRFEGDAYEHVSSVTGEEFAALYHAHGYDRALAKDERSLSYVAALSDRLWLLMIDVNAVTQPGSVPSETLAWIADQLEQAKRSGCRVIAVSHQNLLDHSSLISTGFTIDNAEALLALETEWPVLCHLSGHIHMQHMAKSASRPVRYRHLVARRFAQSIRRADALI